MLAVPRGQWPAGRSRGNAAGNRGERAPLPRHGKAWPLPTQPPGASEDNNARTRRGRLLLLHSRSMGAQVQAAPGARAAAARQGAMGPRCLRGWGWCMEWGAGAPARRERSAVRGEWGVCVCAEAPGAFCLQACPAVVRKGTRGAHQHVEHRGMHAGPHLLLWRRPCASCLLGPPPPATACVPRKPACVHATRVRLMRAGGVASAPRALHVAPACSHGPVGGEEEEASTRTRCGHTRAPACVPACMRAPSSSLTHPPHLQLQAREPT